MFYVNRHQLFIRPSSEICFQLYSLVGLSVNSAFFPFNAATLISRQFNNRAQSIKPLSQFVITRDSRSFRDLGNDGRSPSFFFRVEKSQVNTLSYFLFSLTWISPRDTWIHTVRAPFLLKALLWRTVLCNFHPRLYSRTYFNVLIYFIAFCCR